MKYSIAIIFIIQCHGLAMGQMLGDFLKANAVEVKLDDPSINRALLQKLSQYRLIMMGEMHGTQEPARFVSYLVKQLTSSGTDVHLGLEIPEAVVANFMNQPSPENLRRSDFFSNGYPDGRSNEDWLNLILEGQANPKVKVFFFDTNDDKRDSLMYENVKKHVQDPRSVTVVLSGNIHNRLISSRYGKSMRVYFDEDTTLALSGKICSVNHHYKYGSMKNNMGAGLQLRVIEATPTNFSEATGFKAYFSMLPEMDSPYDAVLYTEKVTAAKILNESK
jgi:hypothetical protein